MLRPDLPKIAQRYAILRGQVLRVEQHVLEGDQQAEVQPLAIPLFQPIVAKMRDTQPHEQ